MPITPAAVKLGDLQQLRQTWALHLPARSEGAGPGSSTPSGSIVNCSGNRRRVLQISERRRQYELEQGLPDSKRVRILAGGMAAAAGTRWRGRRHSRSGPGCYL